ncbi:hypothetical protein K7X08_001042 [Anisodus acutangulus]|uniref:Uncharacterized protein n=1 Tax=Anisodus acutangulus TaxID=402998 RepID=A0A9Q1MMZ3_9SOLA|nr:hypothetical protein K7X08_001042 [Anisodus acutangulus]
MKFYILALHTFQLLASSSFGLSENADRAGITPSLGWYKRLRLLQVESTSPENSFPYGTYTSPPPLPSGAVPPSSPQINSPPFGISTPTPSKSVPPSPPNSSPYGTSTPPTPTSLGAIPPPLLSTSPLPPPSSPSAQTPNALSHKQLTSHR